MPQHGVQRFKSKNLKLLKSQEDKKSRQRSEDLDNQGSHVNEPAFLVHSSKYDI